MADMDVNREKKQGQSENGDHDQQTPNKAQLVLPQISQLVSNPWAPHWPSLLYTKLLLPPFSTTPHTFTFNKNMAKGGKLTITKLRAAVLKKWPSMGKLGRSTSSAIAAVDSGDGEGLRAVYVGKSRRRYLVRPEVAEHPVFQELAERSTDGGGCDGVTVSCEVVLFEHLLWMLENGGAEVESMDELVEFYSC